MQILTVNAGSSSLKLSVLDDDDELIYARRLEPGDHVGVESIRPLLDAADDVRAVGHRIVHGGDDRRRAVVVDDRVAERLRHAAPLAPLHQPVALDVMDRFRHLLPELPHVACFDDAFHTTLPRAARTYAVPRDWQQRFGFERHGFHGLSHAYCARRAGEILDKPVERLRVVVCHLGAGASLAAVSGGISRDTTMGLTPNEGLVMATRSGSLDPSALLWLQAEMGLAPHAMREKLERHSGLLALSGVSSRMEEVVAAAEAGSRQAKLALDVYSHRLRAGIAAMAAAMDGVDCLVFTGGVGEESSRVRSDACAGLGFLGVALDPFLNLAGLRDTDIAGAGSAVPVLVMEAREDVEIAAEARRALRSAPDVRDGAGV